MAFPFPAADELLPTRDSLLNRLKNRDDSASWQDFFESYWRLVYQVARQAGLSHHEAEEVVQETVITVSKRIPDFQYQPEVCSFKTWLLNLTRWRIVDQVRKRPRAELRGSGRSEDRDRTGTVERLPDPATMNLDAVWETEWRDHLFFTAAQRVKTQVSPEQYQLFHLYAMKQWPVRQIMRELGVSATSVYLAKHRVSALIRKEVKSLEKRFR